MEGERREEERRGQAGRMAIAQGMAELEARRGQVTLSRCSPGK